MTERQKLLASYLLNQNEWASQARILEDLELYTNAREIRSDVRALNKSEFSYLIISSKNGYAIANEDQAVAYLNSKKRTALRMLDLHNSMLRKLQNNGQVKVNNADNLVEMRTVCEK